MTTIPTTPIHKTEACKHLKNSTTCCPDAPKRPVYQHHYYSTKTPSSPTPSKLLSISRMPLRTTSCQQQQQQQIIPNTVPTKHQFLCPVCFNTYENLWTPTTEDGKMSCGHIFCLDCIEKMLETTQCCGICRKPYSDYNRLYLS